MTSKAYQYFHYSAFGETLVQEDVNYGKFDAPWRFNGKESDGETGNYYYGARYYKPTWSVWLGVDPLADKFPSMSPFVFSGNNPIMLVDPDGTSTWVVLMDDGTYKVVEGGDPNEGDLNIYVAIQAQDGSLARNDQTIGHSLTSHSFYDHKGNPVAGAIIDLNSTEGQDFIDNEIASAGLLLFEYMDLATTCEPLDFKRRGQESRGVLSEIQHWYRGSLTADGSIASARDFGNLAAGFFAGKNGFPWFETIIAFNLLEIQQDIGKGLWPSFSEPPGTRKAQRIGYEMGVQIYLENVVKHRGNYE
jgi:RHS repeat-associated protein